MSNFTLVQVVGCLTRGANDGWALTKAGAPVVTKEEAPAAWTSPARSLAVSLVEVTLSFVKQGAYVFL